MVKTLREFRDEMRRLRANIFEKGEQADNMLIASWIDKLAMSLEGLSESMELMETQVETACECCSGDAQAPAKKTASKKKTKKKVKKKAVKKKKPAKKKAKKKRR